MYMYYPRMFHEIQFSCIKKKEEKKNAMRYSFTSLFQTSYITDYMIYRYESMFICWRYEFKQKS